MVTVRQYFSHQRVELEPGFQVLHINGGVMVRSAQEISTPPNARVLTALESDVLSLVAEGYYNKEIGPTSVSPNRP